MTIQERAKDFAKEEVKGANPHLVAQAYYCGALDYINKACNLWNEHILKADITEEEFENQYMR